MAQIPIYFQQRPSGLFGLVDSEYAAELLKHRWTLSDRQSEKPPRTMIRFQDPEDGKLYNVAFMLNRVVYTFYLLGPSWSEVWTRSKAEFKTTMDQVPRLRTFTGNWFDCRLENINSQMASSTFEKRNRKALQMGVTHQQLSQASVSDVPPIALPEGTSRASIGGVLNMKISAADELRAIAKTVDNSAAVDAVLANIGRASEDKSRVLDKPPGSFAPPPEDEQSSQSTLS